MRGVYWTDGFDFWNGPLTSCHTLHCLGAGGGGSEGLWGADIVLCVWINSGDLEPGFRDVTLAVAVCVRDLLGQADMVVVVVLVRESWR